MSQRGRPKSATPPQSAAQRQAKRMTALKQKQYMFDTMAKLGCRVVALEQAINDASAELSGVGDMARNMAAQIMTTLPLYPEPQEVVMSRRNRAASNILRSIMERLDE